MAVGKKHFQRAALDIGLHGDNDTLPFDIDNKFIKENQEQLAHLAFEYYEHLNSLSENEFNSTIKSLDIFSERLLTPTGPSGFRIITKIHPFWNLYFNGLCVAVAEKLEPKRSNRAHSYRFLNEGDGLFDREKSWRAYRAATLADESLEQDDAVVVQTDVSSFYEHIYHHRIEDSLKLLFQDDKLARQIDKFLINFVSSSKRSFGLPVGGQGARVLAEVLMLSIDQRLTDAGVIWHRYVDDFTIISTSKENAYKNLSTLSHALADYGLTLNRTKTTLMSAKHYRDYVRAQLGTVDDESRALREIDLRFDPYSDDPESDYEELRDLVSGLNIHHLLHKELDKGLPDTYLVSQVGRTLKFHKSDQALAICKTLVSPDNLHAFRASWSTIMRGIAHARADESKEVIFDQLDEAIDTIITCSSHLLCSESNCLHFLKLIRFKKTDIRSRFVEALYNNTKSDTVRRACIEIWGGWEYEVAFTRLRNSRNLDAQSLRTLWLASYKFGEAGQRFRAQEKGNVKAKCKLGIEDSTRSHRFMKLYMDWAQNV